MSASRILHIVNKMGYGGIETFLMNVYRNIDRNEVQFDFAVHTRQKGDYDEEIKKLGGNIYYFTPRRKSVIQYSKEWKNFWANHKENYKAVHMHSSSLTTILPLKMAKKYGIEKRFMHAHNTYQKGKIHNFLNKWNQRKIDKITTKCFACSTEAGKYVYGKNPFELIPNAMDISKYIFQPQKRIEIRKKLGIEENEIAILHIGRFNYQKNHEFLIDVFEEIAKQQENVKLFLVGVGELQETIKTKVQEKKLEDKVSFFNTRSDVNEIMQAMDLFVFPSWHEGLPVVLIEAQSAGLKIFASETITKEVKITDLVTFLPLTISPKQWAKVILENKEYQRENTYPFIAKAQYDIKEVAKKLMTYYLK